MPDADIEQLIRRLGATCIFPRPRFELRRERKGVSGLRRVCRGGPPGNFQVSDIRQRVDQVARLCEIAPLPRTLK